MGRVPSRLHKQTLAPRFLARFDLVAKLERRRALFIGVGECAHPIERQRRYRLAQVLELRLRLARETNDKRGSESDVRNDRAHPLDQLGGGAMWSSHPAQ